MVCVLNDTIYCFWYVSGNSQNIQLLIHILDHLIGFLENPGTDLPAGAAEDTGSRIRSVNDFLFMTSLDNVNFFNLKRWAIASHKHSVDQAWMILQSAF